MSPHRLLLSVLAGVLAMTLTAAAPARAGGAPRLDLTGRWLGKITCKSFNAGAKDKFTLTPTMYISQAGDALGVLLDYGGGDVERYTALLNPDAKKPEKKGELAIVYCFTNDLVGDEPEYDELGRISVSGKLGNVKAGFKGTSIFSDPGESPAEGGTCKWKYTRVDTTSPGLQINCNDPIIGLPRLAP